MKKILLLLVLIVSVCSASASIKNVKYASFGTPGGNGSYNPETYTYSWTASTNNLMNIFTFSNGELANYSKLIVRNLGGTFTGSWRANVLFSDGKNKDFGWYNYNDKYITLSSWDLTKDEVSHTLADVTAIRIGGNSASGSVVIKWNNVYLENDDDAVLTAFFGSTGGDASYNVPTYSWTNASSNNLMDVFSGEAGDFSKYAEGVLQLNYTRDDNTAGVRIGYHDGSTFTAFNTFYSDGPKTIDISSKSGSAASAGTIKFGAEQAKDNAKSGSITIRPDEMFLVRNEAYNRSFVAGRKSTVWLPFTLNAEEVTAAGTFYELTSVDGTSLTFTEVNTTEAYKPYVFVAKEDGTPFSGMKSKTIVAPKACYYKVGDYTFCGSMKDMKVPNGAYGYNVDDGVFSKATSDNVDIAPFRAYITTTSGLGARAIRCVFGDEITEINEVKSQKKVEDDVLYNLSGQRVSANHKGIVIKNGRKYFKE